MVVGRERKRAGRRTRKRGGLAVSARQDPRHAWTWTGWPCGERDGISDDSLALYGLRRSGTGRGRAQGFSGSRRQVDNFLDSLNVTQKKP